MGELLVLDPAEVAEDRVEVDITPFVGPDGPDFGDAAIEAAMAEAGMYGQSPVDFTVPNRVITIPLSLVERNGTTFEEIRRKVQAKAALFQREGGWLKRETALGTLYADIVNATLKLGAGNLAAWGHADINASLTLECLPDWYGDEIALDAMTGTGELVGVLKQDGVDAVIRGDMAARCRIVVHNDGAEDQFGLIWGLRSDHFDTAATAAGSYEAEDLTPLDLAAVTTLSGASGGASNNVVAHTSLATEWTPVLSTDLTAGGDRLTHTGSYRIWARVSSSDAPNVRLRFVWDVGDLTLPAENSPVAIPHPTSLWLADLGEIRLDRMPAGAHQWQGQIQARGATGGEEIYVDKIWLQPLAEGAGKLTVTLPFQEGLSDFVARDAFDQSAGVLAGKAAPVGGTWAGAGDADDFQVEATGHVAQRAAVSDSSDTAGRYAVLGSATFSDVLVQVNAKRSIAMPGTGGSHQGVIARYADTNNWVMATFSNLVGSGISIEVRKRVAGAVTRLYAFRHDSAMEIGSWSALRLTIDGAGRWAVWANAWEVGRAPALIASYQDPDLATGGSLASGKVGIYDAHTPSSAVTREYDGFLATVPNVDATIFTGRSLELSSDWMLREAADGTGFGRATHVIGDLPRLPPSGIEQRPCELHLKTSRGDLADLPDFDIDDLSAEVFYRPSWLFVPDSDGS